MKFKKTVSATIKLDSKEYESGLKKTAKTTESENKKIAKSNEDTSKASKRSTSEIVLANNAMAQSYGNLRAKSEADLSKLKSSLNSVSSSTSQTSKAVSSNNNSMANSFTQVGGNASRASGTVSSAVSTISSSVASACSTMQNNLNTAGQAFVDLGNKADSIKQSIRAVGEGIKSAGESITKVGNTLTKSVSLPMVGMAGTAIAVESNFEHAFAKVSTLLDLSGKDLDNYKNDLMKNAKEMGVPLGEYSEAVYQAMSAGQSYGDAIGFVSKNVKLAKGGFTDTTTAVNTTTTILNTYGKKAGDVTKISDKLIATQNKGKTTVGELGTALADVIPTANSAGLEFNELLGSFAHLTAKGIQTSKAGTMIRAMLDELGKSGTKASDILKEKTGKTFQQLMKDGKSLTDVLKIVEDGAKEAGLSVGDMFGSSEASGAVKTILDDLGNFNSSVEAVKNSADATSGAYEKMANTTKEQFAKIKASFEEAFVKMGEKLAPVTDMIIDILEQLPEMLNSIDFEGALKPFIEMFKEFGEKILDIINWFTELDPKLQNFIVKSMGVMAVLAPFISLLGGVVQFAGMLTMVLSGPLGGALGGIATFIGSTVLPAIGSLFGVLGTAVTAIGLPWILAGMAIIGIGYLIVKNWDFVKESLNKFSDAIGEKVTAIKDWFVNGWNSIKDKTDEIFDKVVGGITEKVEKVKEKVRNAVDKLKSFFDFDWELPRIKVPRFNIVGKFDLVPPDISMPRIDVSWHAKGGIFTRPTLFNTPGGVHGVGEAGPEAILPLKKLPSLLGLDKKGQGDMNFNFYDTNISGYNDVEQFAKELGMLLRRKKV